MSSILRSRRRLMERSGDLPRRALLATGAGGVAAVLALGGPLGTAFAADQSGTPQVSTTETVKADLTSTGKVDVARIFSQIQASGKGHVELADPTSTQALRNLDGFGAPSVRDGKAVYSFTVDGSKSFRTVADFDKKLPVTVEVTYTLDGKPIAPADLAGRSGTLEVTYHVKNTTAAPTEISYQDGHGKNVTETVDLVTPYVGQATIVLPRSFSAVKSDRSDTAGDGHGGHQLQWTMVLFEPIGQIAQTFSYTAQVTNAAVPATHIQLAPVAPERHPELMFGQHGFASGAASGQQITAGGVQIDENLLKLRAGASKLLTGLAQLQAGADQLNAGLASGVPAAISGSGRVAAGARTAASGAKQIADGNATLAAGLGQLAAAGPQLSAGAGQLGANTPKLAAGAKRLDAGAGAFRTGADQLGAAFANPKGEDLTKGSQALASGLGAISAGLQDLGNVKTGLPSALAGTKALQAALKGAILPAFGTSKDVCDPSDPKKQTVLGCVATLTTGASALQQAILATVDPSAAAAGTARPGLRQGVGLVKAGLDDSLKAGGEVDQLERAIIALKTIADIPAPGQSAAASCQGACKAVVDQLYDTLVTKKTLRTKTTAGSQGLAQVLAGIGDASSPASSNPQAATVVGALKALSGGLTSLQGGLTNGGNVACDPTVTPGGKNYCGLAEGLRQVGAGLDQLVGGLTTAVNGVVGQLSPGAKAASTGAGSLAEGISKAGAGVAQLHAGASALAVGAGTFATGATQYAAGAGQFAAGAQKVSQGVVTAVPGANQLAAGSKTLYDGLNGQLAPGASELATKLTGLTAAVDGSRKIAEGAGAARAGDQLIVDGAGQLSAQGSKKLISSGDEAARSYGRQLAIMQALDKKGADGALPYGAPANTVDNKSAFDLTLAGVGNQTGGAGNGVRGLAAVVVLGLGAGAAGLLRRRLG